MTIGTSRREALRNALLLLSAKAATGRSESPLVIAHVGVVNDTEGLLRDQTVVMEGERITSVAAASGDLPKRGHVIDGRGKYLIPGLWDMHVHLSYTKASALPILLANGVTGVRDCGGLLREIDGWQTEEHTGAMAGPQIVRAGPQVNSKVFAFTQIAVTNADQARGAVKALQLAGVDFIKVIAAISRDAYFGVAQQCKELRIPFAGHIPRVLTAGECSGAGQASLEHIDGLFDGKIPSTATAGERLGAIQQFRRGETPQLFGKLAKNGTYYTPTLMASAYPYSLRLAALERGTIDAHSRYVSRSSKEITEKLLVKYKDDLTPEKVETERLPFREYLGMVKEMNAAGVALLCGTDLATSVFYPGFDVHDELRLMVEAGLTPGAALATATRHPARFLGRKEEGSIAAGQIANVVLLKGNPLEDIGQTKHIHAVMCRGKLFDRDALDALLETGARMA